LERIFIKINPYPFVAQQVGPLQSFPSRNHGAKMYHRSLKDNSLIVVLM